MYKDILYEISEKICTITLNRPEKLNAFTGRMRLELNHAFESADADDGVRVIIVTGAGRGFCAGADLSAGGDTFNAEKRSPDTSPEEREELAKMTPNVHGGDFGLCIMNLRKPVIAAINGPAVGIGATMILPMDIRLASPTARIGFPFARLGVAPEECSSWFLPRLVGMQQALHWLYTAKLFSAEEALKAGLVMAIHEPDELLPEARKMAKDIADNTAPVSVALIRQLLWRSLAADHPMAAHNIEVRAVPYTGSSKDCREGVESFLMKRPPNFTGKLSTDMPDFYPWWEERPFE